MQKKLTGKQIRFLRALGHHLDPVTQIGKHGLTDASRDAVGIALSRHELVKVRVGTECPDDRHELAERLAEALTAHVAQLLGRTILLYRRHPSEPSIVLPDEKAKAERKAPGRDDGAGTRGKPSEAIAHANRSQGTRAAAAATDVEPAAERPARGARSRKPAGSPKPSAARTAARKAAWAAEAEAEASFARGGRDVPFARDARSDDDRGASPQPPRPAGGKAYADPDRQRTRGPKKGGLSHGRPARGRWSDGAPMGGPNRRPSRRADGLRPEEVEARSGSTPDRPTNPRATKAPPASRRGPGASMDRDRSTPDRRTGDRPRAGAPRTGAPPVRRRTKG
jgi:RNA-binding protein